MTSTMSTVRNGEAASWARNRRPKPEPRRSSWPRKLPKECLELGHRWEKKETSFAFSFLILILPLDSSVVLFIKCLSLGTIFALSPGFVVVFEKKVITHIFF